MQPRRTHIAVRTEGPVKVHDVSEPVRQAVRESGVRQGIVLVSVPHTTCALCINENEAGLRADLERLGREVLEPLARAGAFEHDRVDDNARAHLTSVLIGHQTALAVENGEPRLGTWQSILLLELDGPRQRTIEVQVLGV